MKNKYIIILLICLSFPLLAMSQGKDELATISRLAITAGYYGDFVMHPGLSAGVEYSLHRKKSTNIHWNTELGAYHHKWNNSAAFLQTTIGTRVTTRFALSFDINAGVGYMLTAPAGDIYRMNDSGELDTKGRPLNSHLKPGFSFLFGWDGNRKRDIPLVIQAGLETYFETAFNHSMLPHAALKAGVVYSLKSK